MTAKLTKTFTYFNRMLYHFKRNALVEGSTHLKGMHHSFSRESFKVFEYVLTQGFEPTMSISKSVLRFDIFIGCLCFCMCSTQFWKKYINKQNCLICNPKPPKLPPVIPAFCHVFLHDFLMEPQAQSNQ